MEARQGKRKFDNPRNKKFRDNKKKNRPDKERRENAKSKKNVKVQREAKVYTPSFVVYEPFSCPSEILTVLYIKNPITYRRSDGKVSTFQKGQLVMKHPGDIISTLDGRYGKEIL